MASQRTQSQTTPNIGALVLAGAIVVGAAGGYAAREAGITLSGAQSTGASLEAAHTIVVPRAAREGTDISPWQAPAPRWTHEDDVLGSPTK